MRAVIEPPAQEAITLERAKLHLLIDDEADAEVDAAIEDTIVAAREALEGELLRPLLPQRCRVKVDRLVRRIRLWQDVIDVESVTYTDGAGADQVLPPAAYTVEGGADLVLIGDVPAGTAVRVEFRCGAFAEPESVPRSLVSWMLLQIGALYEIRQAVTHGQTFEAPTVFAAGLINRYRVVGL